MTINDKSDNERNILDILVDEEVDGNSQKFMMIGLPDKHFGKGAVIEESNRPSEFNMYRDNCGQVFVKATVLMALDVFENIQDGENSYVCPESDLQYYCDNSVDLSAGGWDEANEYESNIEWAEDVLGYQYLYGDDFDMIKERELTDGKKDGKIQWYVND